MNTIGERFAAVQRRVAAALNRAGRAPGSARVIAVSKRHPVEVIRAAQAAGIADMGENYAQEMTAKMDALGLGPETREADVPQGESQGDQDSDRGSDQDSDQNSDRGSDRRGQGPGPELRFHFIGHLQRNKAKFVVGRAALIHAVDSEALARAIDRHAAGNNLVQPVLLAVNVGGEAQKSGVALGQAPGLLDVMAGCAHLSCVGLMTMPPLASTPEQNRTYFQRLCALREQLRRPDLPLPELSMGTTADFEVAIEEGATLVRVGTAIFGPRPV